MELVPVYLIVSDMEDKLFGRSKAIEAVAKQLNITIPTLYRWLKHGDHFLVEEDDVESVFKLVKCNEKESVK